MRLSTRTEYGIQAMLDLAEHVGEGPIQSHDIARRQEIPEPYLNQLLTLLRKAGLIASRRGPGGGHLLARPAREITLSELLEALEGPLFSSDDGAEHATRPVALREAWREVNETAERILSRVTLADVLERERGQAELYDI